MKREKISLVKAVAAVVTGIILFLILTVINKTGSEAFFKAYAAETVSILELSIIPEDDDDMSPGDKVSGMEPTLEDSKFYVDELEVSNSDPAPKKAYYYTISLVPESGYVFSNDPTIKIHGATDITVKSKSNTLIKLRVKTYPYHVLNEVKNIKIDKESGKATWDKVDYAKTYNVVVRYTNKNGNEKEAKKTAKTNSLDIKSYIKRYDDVYVSVQAVKGNAESDKFLANSDYVFEDGSVDEDYSEDDYVFTIPAATNGSNSDNYSSNDSSNNNSNRGNSRSDAEADGWHGSGENWYYIYGGKKIAGWLSIGSENDDTKKEWYIFDSNGKMLTGWQYVNNRWYLFNNKHDGTFGRMLTGWQQMNGKWYYMSTAGSNYGTMLSNTTTPDGYKVGSDGAWIK